VSLDKLQKDSSTMEWEDIYRHFVVGPTKHMVCRLKSVDFLGKMHLVRSEGLEIFLGR